MGPPFRASQRPPHLPSHQGRRGPSWAGKPKISEVAEELGLGLDEYYSSLSDANSGRLFSLDELNESGELPIEETEDSDNPLDGLASDNFRKSLAAAIGDLPEREKLVLSLYYQEELNLKEIGAVLGVSESRVSQIHSQAALRLRGRLSDWRQESDS